MSFGSVPQVEKLIKERIPVPGQIVWQFHAAFLLFPFCHLSSMASSVAVGGFVMNVDIDGEHFEFRNFSDLESLSRDRALRILEILLFVERPRLLVEASQIPRLREEIEKLTQEKEFYFRKAQTIEELSAKIVQYHHENESLQKELSIMKQSMEDVKEQYVEVSAELMALNGKFQEVKARLDSVIQPISARQLAMNADKAAISAIFPECRRKPYYLRSYSNLLSFLSNPESDQFAGPLAAAAWWKLTEDDRVAIKTRAEQFVVQNPDLRISIKTLKEEWEQAHSCTTVEETLSFIEKQGEEEACDAVKVCATMSVKSKGTNRF
ncbi:hypothetical protein EON65_57445 [archaeon]|nr:MAG: hypothetical protein EON65_57445 [archaeon]